MAEAMMGGSAPQPTMEDFAAFEQIRQEVSPSEINETLLATAAEADPMAVAEFKSELRDLDLPPEVLDALDGMVDEILAAPERYAEIRAQYLAQDMSEDLLPEVFDAEFFGALNMALDEIRATSGGPARAPQGFARGGIASLGRNGDTMLAHVTPAEMRMLKANGGAGTINPRTGLPEFFSLKKVFSKIGRAAKKFARSTIGKIVIGTALFFVAGPAATAMFGTTAAPALIAATQGFVAGAGSSLLAGESLRDSLKMGAIGAISAGAFTGVTQGASAFQSTTPVTQVGAGGFELAAGPLNPGAEVAQTAIPSDVGFQSGLPKLDTSPLSTSVDSALRAPVSTVNPVTSALNTPQAGGIPSANTSGFTSPLTPAQTYAAPRIDPGLNRSALPGATAPQSRFSLSESVLPGRLQPLPRCFTDQVKNLGPNGTPDTTGILGLSRNAPPPPPQSLMDKATSLPGKAWDKISPKAIGERYQQNAFAKVAENFPGMTEDAGRISCQTRLNK
jgi:hypothetical protein